MADVVVTKGITKRYEEVEALRGVDLAVREGEVFGLLGPNGAGKTTLINILTTMLAPTTGDAWIDGRSVLTEGDDVRKRLGVVFQGGTLDSVMTAEENLRIHGRLYKVPKADIEARIPELLAVAGLTDRAKDRVQTYSGGMRRRLEIVRSVMHRPKVLLLDEPTVALDPQSRAAIWEYVQRIARDYNVTILLTTHYMEEADRLCDRVAIIDHGRIVALDSPTTLKAQLGGDHLTLKVMGGDPRLVVETLESIENVLGASADDGALNLRLREPASTIPAVLHAVADAKLRVLEMKHRPSSMDDVFLSRTGKSTRDKKRKKRNRFLEMLRGE